MSRKHSSSTGSTDSNGSVDKETLDEYMDLVDLGREAFTSGKIKDAELFFSDALELELDTELDIIKKNQRIRSSASIGSMSDLSLDSIKSGSVSAGCPSPSGYLDSPGETFTFNSLLRGTHMPATGLTQHKEIWSYLETSLKHATAVLKLNPKNANAYLKKASALSLMNRWSDAKEVYREGLRNCKGSQKLNLALDAILKLEASTKKLADVSPRVAAESSQSARCTPPPGSQRVSSMDSYLSPLMPRKNKFSISSWSSLDNLERPRASPKMAKRISPNSRNSPLRHSVDALGSTDSLPRLSLGSTVKASLMQYL